jgi:hypothetical protein
MRVSPPHLLFFRMIELTFDATGKIVTAGMSRLTFVLKS